MVRYLNITVDRFDVHEEAVQSYIRVGGEVNDLLNDVAQSTFHYSQRYLMAGGHNRSFRLYKGLGWTRAKTEGPLQAVARARSTARYTEYFHEGTGTIIHPWMIIPNNKHVGLKSTAFKGAGAEQLALWKSRSARQQKTGRGFKLRRSVQGQRAKPFLREGLASSLASHGLK